MFTIKNILRGCFSILGARWQHFLTALAIPVVLTFALPLLLPITDSMAANAFHLLAAIVLQSLIALITHRLVLIQETVPPWGLQRFGRAELVFVAHYVLIFGMFNVLFFFVQSVLQFLAIVVIGIWLLSRISLVFPALAVGDQASIMRSWQMTRGHQATMLMVIFFFPLVVGIVGVLVRSVISYAEYLVEPLAIAFTVMALSLAYAYIKRPDYEVDG